MIRLTINGSSVQVEDGSTLLEAARLYGIPIPTLCHEDGLTPYGACRLCVVELGVGRLVSSCTTRALEGMVVRTNSQRVERARRLLLELYVATSPQSKRIQDLASAMGVRECRYEAQHEDCIQCGLCVRICAEQMMGGAIAFAGRGKDRRVARPFDQTSELCRQCGACLWVCPVCELRCQASTADTALCNACLNFAPACFKTYDDAMCFLDPCHACELAGPFRADARTRIRAASTAR
ncbi:MAG TPA: 2Fe-2S iron-sulfur cluster-binding protein [Gemmatimonadales bacterium]|nr:2Fe-2S iron-sulfur cluster-binding protein [Gemmatimonadales bacterium]